MQGVGEQGGVCICDADVGSVDGSVSEGQDVHLLVEHRDAPHTRGR